MNEISTSPDLAAWQTQQQILTSVAKKALDSVRQQGEAINQLLTATARSGRADGKGEQFDAHA